MKIKAHRNRIGSKLLLLLLTLVLAAQLGLPAAAATYPIGAEVGAQAVYLYNLDTDTLIAEKNMDEPMYPASLTKIMTCILALENTPNLDTEKVVYPNYIQDYLYNYQWVQKNGAVSLADLRAGEELSMRQLLYALMLPSANEAAMIIADHIGGSQEDFARMMNARAKELGANHTNFVNPNGLFDEKHVTTAYDIAQITKHALELPGFLEIVTTIAYDSGPTNFRENVVWDTTIKMQVPSNTEYYYPGIKGVKTGSLPQAGSCYVSTCTRDGFTYLLVVLGSPYLDENGKMLARMGSFEDTKNIYDWVFATFKRKSLVEKGAHVQEVKLNLSLEKDHIKLMTGERFTALVPVTTEVSDVTQVPEIPESVNAPVQKGDHIGELRLILGGEEIGRVSLLAAESVEASPILLLWEKVKSILSSFWFKFLVILLVLLILFYIFIMILRNRNRRRRGYRPRRRI